jgi:hypothetical protein
MPDVFLQDPFRLLNKIAKMVVKALSTLLHFQLRLPMPSFPPLSLLWRLSKRVNTNNGSSPIETTAEEAPAAIVVFKSITQDTDLTHALDSNYRRPIPVPLALPTLVSALGGPTCPVVRVVVIGHFNETEDSETATATSDEGPASSTSSTGPQGWSTALVLLLAAFSMFAGALLEVSKSSGVGLHAHTWPTPGVRLRDTTAPNAPASTPHHLHQRHLAFTERTTATLLKTVVLSITVKALLTGIWRRVRPQPAVPAAPAVPAPSAGDAAPIAPQAVNPAAAPVVTEALSEAQEDFLLKLNLAAFTPLIVKNKVDRELKKMALAKNVSFHTSTDMRGSGFDNMRATILARARITTDILLRAANDKEAYAGVSKTKVGKAASL